MDPTGQLRQQEIESLQELFLSCCEQSSGKLTMNQLHNLLIKLGKTEDAISYIVEEASKANNAVQEGISFQDFVVLIQRPARNSDEQPLEGADPKVIEFLRILEEYRIKCEEEGNYLEASRANKQLELLRKQEEMRQQKAIRARQLVERQDIQVAHSMQYHEFNKAWDKYMEDFDSMAQKYIHQMTERHAANLLEFQNKLRDELAKKPPKWSRELIEQRRQQAINAKSRNYVEAQRLKAACDRIELREKEDIEQNLSLIFARREVLYRQHQQVELQALLKRIECRRKEHIKQRNVDCKRLLQRNRNVQAVLESKQSLECQKLFEEIKKSLHIHQILSSSHKHSNPRSSSPKSQLGSVHHDSIFGSQEGFDNTNPMAKYARSDEDMMKGDIDNMNERPNDAYGENQSQFLVTSAYY